MAQYGSYPIYIVYSDRTQDATFDLAWEYLKQDDKKLYENIATKGMSRMEIVEDSNPAYKHEVDRYHRAISSALDEVASSVVGKCILNSLYPAEKVYIIPSPFTKDVAQTQWSLTVSEGNGMRLRINPRDWARENNLDDAIVHELTHATRLGWSRQSRIMLTASAGNWGGLALEEFFAMQMANMYRSSKGKKNLYADYHYTRDLNKTPVPIWGDKAAIYADFTDHAELVLAVKHLLQHDPMAKQLSGSGGPDFNPFRDLPGLESEAKKKLGMAETEQFMPL